MAISSINPATGELVQSFASWHSDQIHSVLSQVEDAQTRWAVLTIAERAQFLRKVAQVLREHRDEYAELITEEVGKLLRESRAEIDKCAIGCDYYADHAASFLAREDIKTDAQRSYVIYQPLGILFCIMPWNFPFWQLIRAAAPALMAGNAIVLKHASNVPRCALALEQAFSRAGFPDHIFRTFMVGAEQAESIIADRRIAAVTLTGSTAAGRKVAAVAGRHLKKCVLELGGSDPFIVLDDADIDSAATQAVSARLQNMGQSCIAAKRFILLDSIADAFVEQFKQVVQSLRSGDPRLESTGIAPMAREDLRNELHAQVERSVAMGARRIAGGAFIDGPGAYYLPTILDHVRPGMPAFDEELFGPVAAMVRVGSEQEAIALANRTDFGLGGSIWTGDTQRGEQLVRQIHAGSVFVNGIVKSDPRLPFGGVRDSGYGRELSHYGIREFVNVKTVWVK